MVYQSFETKKNKIRKNWIRIKDNNDNLKKIDDISLKFNSINFNKKISEYIIYNNEPIISFSDTGYESILLENFPEWAISSIEPLLLFSIGDGYIGKITTGNAIDKFFAGTLENGDVFLPSSNIKYWFVRQDNTHFLMKYYFNNISASEANVVEFGFSLKNIPTYITFKLKFYNYRNYHTTNEKFE